MRAAIGVDVGAHTTVVIPVVDQGHDQLDSILLGRGYHVVKSLQAIWSGVDGIGSSRWVVQLEPDRSRAGDAVDIVETPGAEDLQPRLLQMVEDGVNIRIIHQEGQPVGVAARKVLGLAVNRELESICFGEGATPTGLASGRARIGRRDSR